MKAPNVSKNIKFWVDRNIIHCQINDQLNKQSHISGVDHFFLNNITVLSDDKYLPVLVDMRMMPNVQAIKLFRFLSKNASITSSVLSITFLVRSAGLKVLLSLYDYASNPFAPHKICFDFDLAVKHCHQKNKIFNALK